jgi:hypothetical protein
MREGEKHEGGAGDDVGRDVLRDVCDETIGEGRPHILVCDTVVSPTVFEGLEVLLR